MASSRQGNDNLLNAMNTFGQNTYFLPSDIAFSKYTDRNQLNNFTFLYDILFKSHRVSNRILFDYYLDGPTTYYTDTLLPVNTIHRRLSGQNVDDIEISIGHVKGKISPDLRNIFCVSGVVHVIDTVLGVPTKSAYQELISQTTLSTFRSLVDRSTKYRSLLDQLPTTIVYPTQPPLVRAMQERNNRGKRQFNQQTNQQFNQGGLMQPQQQQQQSLLGYNNPNDIRQLTILAPQDAALYSLRDFLLQNDTALDQFLSTHIIVDNSNNRVFYTEHDQNVFQTGQVYPTLYPNTNLVATVTESPNEVTNSKHVSIQL